MRDKDTNLAVLVTDLVRRFGGNKQDFAKAVGISPSALSRLMAQPMKHQPSPEVCLRLARVGRVSGARVMRAAGYAILTDLIEELFGAAADQRQRFFSVTPREQTHLEEWRDLDPDVQKALNALATAAYRRKQEERAERGA